MIGLAILLAHLVGDYIVQSDWMANYKTVSWLPAIAHGITYALCYAVLCFFFPISIWALLVIGGTHILIDHYRWAKQLSWFKNQLVPKRFRYTWSSSKETGGYKEGTPAWLWFFLMVVADNTAHLVINVLAIILL